MFILIILFIFFTVFLITALMLNQKQHRLLSKSKNSLSRSSSF